MSAPPTSEQQARFGAVFAMPGARIMLACIILGRAPQGMVPLAVLLMVHDRFDSFAMAGIAVGGFSLGIGLAAPTVGTVIDRAGPRAVLPRSGLAFALATAALLAGDAWGLPSVPTIFFAIVIGAAVPPVSAIIRTTWTQAISDADVRSQAFALDAMATQAMFALGPLWTSLIVVLASPEAAIVVSAAVAVTGALLLTRSPLVKQVEHQRRGRQRASIRTSRYGALRSKPLRFVLTGVCLVGAANGTMEIGLPAIAAQLGSKPMSGVLLGVWATGGVVGGWLYSTRSWRMSPRSRYRTVALIAAGLTLPLVLTWSVPSAIVLSLVAGLPQAAVYTCQYGLVGEAAPRESLNEAFMWMVAATVGGLAIGSAIGGVLVADAGAHVCLVLGAVFLAAVAIVPVALQNDAAVATCATTPESATR